MTCSLAAMPPVETRTSCSSGSVRDSARKTLNDGSESTATSSETVRVSWQRRGNNGTQSTWFQLIEPGHLPDRIRVIPGFHTDMKVGLMGSNPTVTAKIPDQTHFLWV